MISVKTASCEGCSSALVEAGLQLELAGRYGAHCTTASLDNRDLRDYTSNHEAVFHSGSPDAGLGSCNNVGTYHIVNLHCTANFKTQSAAV